ncbi:MAG: sugar transferase [bacterium]|nr:sugar transferase [bacterium]
MLTQQEKQAGYSLALLDALALVLAFTCAFVVRLVFEIPFASEGEPPLAAHIWSLLLSVPIFWVLASSAGLYRRTRPKSKRRLLWATIRPVAYMGLIVGTAVFLFQADTYSRTIFFAYIALSLVFVTGVRMLVRAFPAGSERDAEQNRRVLIVGAGLEGVAIARRLSSHEQPAYHLIGHLVEERVGAEIVTGASVVGGLSELKVIVEEEVVDDVIFAVPFAALPDCRPQIAWCEEVGVTVHLSLDFMGTLMAKTYPTNWDGIPMLTLSTTPQDAIALLFKRIVDIGGSAFGLLVASPVMIACALLIRITSPGPVLFRQQRVGLNGRTFQLYKFRSMYRDAERRQAELQEMNEMSGPVFKIRRDPRVTPVGRLLRKFSIDELPQLWNVLRGDMSLVGPRPPVPQEVRQYERWQRRRLSMKPGLTCLWQINGRNKVGFDEWMKLDLAYIDNWSIKLDIIILLRTLPAVLLTRGAH